MIFTLVWFTGCVVTAQNFVIPNKELINIDPGFSPAYKNWENIAKEAIKKLDSIQCSPVVSKCQFQRLELKVITLENKLQLYEINELICLRAKNYRKYKDCMREYLLR